MEGLVRDAVDGAVTLVEVVGAIVIVVGVAVAFAHWVLSEVGLRPVGQAAVRLALGRSLALGLEFQLGADILSSAVSPTFDEIGKLGAIAVIRTALNYFLSKEQREAP